MLLIVKCVLIIRTFIYKSGLEIKVMLRIALSVTADVKSG